MNRNPQDIQAALEKLDRQIEELKAAGNQPELAMAYAQKALLYTLNGDLAAAAREAARAGELAGGAGRQDVAALADLARGKALLNQPGQRKQAAAALRQAAQAFAAAGSAEKEAAALKELAGLDLAEGNLDRAMQRLDKALAALQPASPRSENAGGSESGAVPAPAPALQIEIYRIRATVHLMRNDVSAASADQQAAIELAEAHGDTAQALQIRVESALLQNMSGENEAQLKSLLATALRSGNLAAVSDLQLQEAVTAFGAGQFEQALNLARAARQAARDSQDLTRPVRYLMASLLMADASERLGDRNGVLAALLTCKVYLEKVLGPAVGQAMNSILDGLETRWGRAGLVEAVRHYQAWAKENPPTV